jgi:hypothetical protein
MAHYSPIETSQPSSELLDIAKKRIGEPKAIVSIDLSNNNAYELNA